MKVDNKIYFAPGIEFGSVNWDDHHSLAEHFRARVYAYYLTPAQRMSGWISDQQHDPYILLGIAFGSGVICCTTIDFLAQIEFGISRVGERYRMWLRKYASKMADPDTTGQKPTIAHRFYDDFRNGLVHEGHVKNAGQFSLDPNTFDPPSQLFVFVGDAMVVHPLNLLDAIEAGLNQYCDELHGDPIKLADFALTLNTTFQADIDYSSNS